MNKFLFRMQQRLRYHWWTYLEKKGKINNREMMARLCEVMSGAEVAALGIPVHRKLAVQIAYPNIVVFTRTLKEINGLIRRKQTIKAFHTDVVFSQRFLDEFFIDAEGYYVEIPTTFDKFRNECRTLLSLTKDFDTKTPGYEEYVHRVLDRTVFLAIEIFLRSISEKVMK